MTRDHNTYRIPLFAALALVLAFAVPERAQADDPNDAFPPAPPAADDTPAPAEGKPSESAPTSDWSPPAVTPGRDTRPTMNDPSLPPPRIVRRRSGTPVQPRAPLPAQPRSTTPYAPTGPTTTGTRPASGQGAVRVTPRTPPTAAQPRMPVRSTAPAQPAVTTTPPETMQPIAPGAQGRVIGITKLHNVPLGTGRAQPGGEDELALQLDVDYEVRGQRGRDVYVAIWFVRATDGTMIRSSVPSYGDRNGNATLQTRAARVSLDAARYKATLRIPYRAFPMGAGEASYDVEARVQVLRTEARGQVTVLCRGSTTFRVYGFEEGTEPASTPADRPRGRPVDLNAPRDAFPEAGAPGEVVPGVSMPGVSIPGEGGRISDPGR